LTRRRRSVRYGASGALVVAGVACGALVSGTTGGTLATALIGLGLVGIVSLIFYEVGLSEDRDRARSQEAAERRAPPASPGEKTRRPLRPRRPDRMRGQRRRLR
jgi:hypothetical protein